MKKTKGKIPVHCSYSEMLDISQLKPNPKNPNNHPPEQVEKLARIIEAHGWRHPVTVSKRSGYIVSGHCRLQAALKLELKQIPIDEQDFASEAEELAVLVADNKIAELSEIDSGKMDYIISELTASDYDLELACVDVDELEPVSMDYSEEQVRPFTKSHILLSFSPELLMRIEPHLKAIMEIEGVEYEQSSN